MHIVGVRSCLAVRRAGSVFFRFGSGRGGWPSLCSMEGQMDPAHVAHGNCSLQRQRPGVTRGWLVTAANCDGASMHAEARVTSFTCDLPCTLPEATSRQYGVEVLKNGIAYSDMPGRIDSMTNPRRTLLQ